MRCSNLSLSPSHRRYRQNLKPQSGHVSNWARQLQSLQHRAKSHLEQHTDPAIGEDFFDQSEGVSSEHLVKYLWGLRDTMLKDSLKLSAVL